MIIWANTLKNTRQNQKKKKKKLDLGELFSFFKKRIFLQKKKMI